MPENRDRFDGLIGTKHDAEPGHQVWNNPLLIKSQNGNALAMANIEAFTTSLQKAAMAKLPALPRLTSRLGYMPSQPRSIPESEPLEQTHRRARGTCGDAAQEEGLRSGLLKTIKPKDTKLEAHA